MLIPNRNFNEKYYINRKKILQDFLKDEETETLKNIDDTENLVSKTKMILKGIVTGEYDYSIIKERLAEIDNDLVTDCENYNKDLENLICNMFQKEGTLLFNSGYHANVGINSSIVTKGDVIFSDKLNHASIIDGMQLLYGNKRSREYQSAKKAVEQQIKRLGDGF